jgi:hypothetical protein
MLPRVDDNRQVNASRKRMYKKKRERRRRKGGKTTQEATIAGNKKYL